MPRKSARALSPQQQHASSSLAMDSDSLDETMHAMLVDDDEEQNQHQEQANNDVVILSPSYSQQQQQQQQQQQAAMRYSSTFFFEMDDDPFSSYKNDDEGEDDEDDDDTLPSASASSLSQRIKDCCKANHEELTKFYNMAAISLGAADYNRQQPAFAAQPSPKVSYLQSQESYTYLPYDSSSCKEYLLQSLLQQQQTTISIVPWTVAGYSTPMVSVFFESCFLETSSTAIPPKLVELPREEQQSVLHYLVGMLQNTCIWGGGDESSFSSLKPMPCPRTGLAAWTLLHFSVIVNVLQTTQATPEAWRRWMCGLIFHLPTNKSAEMLGSNSRIATYKFLAYAIALCTPDAFGMQVLSDDDDEVRAWKLEEIEKTKQTRTDLLAHLLGHDFSNMGWRVAKSIYFNRRPAEYCMLPLGEPLGQETAANFYAYCYPWLEPIAGKVAITGSAFYNIQTSPVVGNDQDPVSDKDRWETYLEVFPPASCDLNVVLRPHYVDTVGKGSVVRAARMLVKEIQEFLQRKWRQARARFQAQNPTGMPPSAPQIQVREGWDMGRLFVSYQHDGVTYRPLSISVCCDEGVDQGLYSTCATNEVVVLPFHAKDCLPKKTNAVALKKIEKQVATAMSQANKLSSSARRQKSLRAAGTFETPEEQARFNALTEEFLSGLSASRLPPHKLHELAETEALKIVLEERKARLLQTMCSTSSSSSSSSFNSMRGAITTNSNAFFATTQKEKTQLISTEYKSLALAVFTTRNYRRCIETSEIPMALAEKHTAARLRARPLPAGFQLSPEMPVFARDFGQCPQPLELNKFKIFGRTLEQEETAAAEKQQRFCKTLADIALLRRPVDDYRCK